MLSRTAEGLFWMGRYIERMENVARLLDAGRYLGSLPREPSRDQSEWSSVIVASGASETFPHPLGNADADNVADHLIRDLSNPSSISSCIEAARMNAKAIRNSITVQVWESVNDTWGQFHTHLKKGRDRKNLADFLDWVRMRGGLSQGKIDNTMLRDDTLQFIELGKWFERADATARLLDVKYHVLLPDVKDVGAGLDYLQWVQILRSVNSLVAFRHLYSRTVDPQGVVDLLILNEKSPRSLLTSMSEIARLLNALASDLPVQQQLAQEAAASEAELRAIGVDQIFSQGLHDWLTDFIVNTNIMANQTSTAFGFGAMPSMEGGEDTQ